MKHFKFEGPGGEISERDKAFLSQEVHEEIADGIRDQETKYRMYEKIEQDLSGLIQDYFPDEYCEFKWRC